MHRYYRSAVYLTEDAKKKTKEMEKMKVGRYLNKSNRAQSMCNGTNWACTSLLKLYFNKRPFQIRGDFFLQIGNVVH